MDLNCKSFKSTPTWWSFLNDSNIFFICQTVGKLSYSEKINTNFKYRKTTFKRYFHLVVISRHVSTVLLVFDHLARIHQKMVKFNPGLSQTLGSFFLPKNIVEPSLLDAEVTLRLTRIHRMEQRKFFFPCTTPHAIGL